MIFDFIPILKSMFQITAWCTWFPQMTIPSF